MSGASPCDRVIAPCSACVAGSVPSMEVVGLTVDLPVSDVRGSVEFYSELFQREPDLSPEPGIAEWVLRRDPDLALRIVGTDALTAELRVGIAVIDVELQRQRLASPATVVTKPGVIASLTLRDPDGHHVVLWQDLMQSS
ncbi:MAG: hypothetical protein JWN99_1672 [Ilumatobacteraceae bacterium]|nr:hypothetical protein [Ilumatobacteraceae bacterium]